MTCRDEVDIMASPLKGKKKTHAQKFTLLDNGGGSRKNSGPFLTPHLFVVCAPLFCLLTHLVSKW